MNKVRYFFFDCFEVIFSGIISTWIVEFFPEEKSSQLIKGPMVDVDRGDMTLEELISLLSKESNWSEDRIKDEFQKRIKPNKEMVFFLKELSKDHSVYLLSNASSDHLYDVLSTEPGIESIFKRIYVSSKMHLVKPSVEFFEYVLNDLGADPRECIFIDDNIKNIEGAEKAGIRGIQFLGFESFKKQIEPYL